MTFPLNKCNPGWQIQLCRPRHALLTFSSLVACKFAVFHVITDELPLVTAKQASLSSASKSASCRNCCQVLGTIQESVCCIWIHVVSQLFKQYLLSFLHRIDSFPNRNLCSTPSAVTAFFHMFDDLLPKPFFRNTNKIAAPVQASHWCQVLFIITSNTFRFSCCRCHVSQTVSLSNRYGLSEKLSVVFMMLFAFWIQKFSSSTRGVLHQPVTLT
mmetsp:Transcript_21485/g.50447  ORF Transcript_21485/g.50447 Transcript_21485/m.50447 type:complete len:214 (-) Transcript_21485:278-919(-)